jgi:hypothetical protein
MEDFTLYELEHLAARLRTQPGTLAHTLAAWDDTPLQLRLGVDRLGLVRLRMCKTPHTPAALAIVARYTGANPDALAALLGLEVGHE